MSCASSGHINKTWAIYFCTFQYLCIICYKILDICGNLRLLLFMGMKYSHFHFTILQSSWSKGISEMRLKHQNPCSKCMHWPVISQADACTSQAYEWIYCMHCPMMSQVMHAVTAWALLFWFHLGYTFISSYFDYFMLSVVE
jgi:hypothetical protein